MLATKMAEIDQNKFSYSVGGTVSSPESPLSTKPAPGTLTWDPVERWLRDKRPRCKQVYGEYMTRFLAHAGFKTPQEFLDWTRGRDPIQVEELLLSFLAIIPPASKGTPASALKTFLDRNGYKSLPKDFVTHQVKEATENRPYYRGFTREEIILLLSYLDRDLEKLFVYVQKDTGFRKEVTLGLRYHNIKADFEAGKDFCHVKLLPQQYLGRKRAGITFVGPDSTRFLRELAKKGLVKPNPDTCQPPDPSHRKPGKCTCSRIFPWRYSTIRETIRLAMSKAGLDPKLQPTHGLRKFFEDGLGAVRPGLDVYLRAQLEGRGLVGSKWHYTPQAPEVLLPYYKESYQYLDLSEQGAVNKTVQGLEGSYKEALKKIERLENDKSLEDRIASLEHKNKELMIYMLAGAQGFVPLAPEKLHQIPTEELEEALDQYAARVGQEAARKSREEPSPAYQLGLQIGKQVTEKKHSR